MLNIALKECEELRISLTKRCETYEDELAVATAFAEQSAEIWKKVAVINMRPHSSMFSLMTSQHRKQSDERM